MGLTLLDKLIMSFCILFTTISIIPFIKKRLAPNHQLPLPPGPRGLPIIGNLIDLPRAKDRAWEVYAGWSDRYGDIISTSVLGYTLVVLNDPDMATDLLEKRGTNYADRPQFPLFVLSGLQRFMTLMPYGPTLRDNRKMVSRILGNAQAVKEFYPCQEFQATMLAKRILANPDDLEHAIRRTASALILQITYGYKVKEDERDDLVGLAEDAVTTFLSMSHPSHFLINLFPSLHQVPSWFPFITGYNKFVKKCRASIDRMMDKPLLYVQEEMAKGTHVSSYVSDLLLQIKPGDDEQQTLDNIRWSAASLYGGADTTVATTYSYFLAVTAYPEVQQKLQDELDAVVGRDRLPTFDDRPSLPYAEAVSKEVLRWMPVGPLGIPHLAMSEDIYSGYYIPKGAIVCANIWKFLHDSKRYKDPRRFNPDRFLEPNSEQDPVDFCFGFGRRICPGSKLAEATAWINVVKSAATLFVCKAKDGTGNDIEPVCEQTAGILSHPMSFKCTIRPRYSGVEGLINEATQS